MKKSRKVEALLGSLGPEKRVGGGAGPLSRSCYAGYFALFNAGRYYEAHDVLEHLWLLEGRDSPNYAFHKGLIQLAGAFVHMRLHHAQPGHPKHGGRLAPARRLLLLAEENLSRYPSRHSGIDLGPPLALCREYARQLDDGQENPWRPGGAPRLVPPEASPEGDGFPNWDLGVD